jgi:hypothetical protein
LLRIGLLKKNKLHKHKEESDVEKTSESDTSGDQSDRTASTIN